MATSRERTEAIGLLDLASRLESIDINHDGEACSYFGVGHGQCKGCPAYERTEICIDVALADAARRIRECCYGDGAGGALHAGGETNATEEDDGLLRMCNKKWFEYARWVDGQGGLDDVKESVEQSACRKKLLDCFAMRLGFESLEDAGDIFNELEKRLMPDGMEWPRYEDGELVPIGGEFMGKDGKTYTAKQIQFIGKCFSLYDFCDRKPQFSGFYGERVRHPAVPAADGEPLEVGQTVWNINNGMEFTVSRLPKSGEYQAVEVRYRNGSSTSFDPDQLTHQRPVLDADGNRIEEGMGVWWICDGDERGIHAEKLHVDGIDVDGIVECSPCNGGTRVCLEPEELYVNKPVLDAYGVPIKGGDAVYLWDKYRDYAGSVTSMCSMIGIHSDTCLHVVKVDDRRLKFDECLASCPPDWVTHEPPDSWEKYEEKLCYLLDDGDLASKMTERAKALAERGRDENRAGN